jgi:ABC-2 type transport system permease protein
MNSIRIYALVSKEIKRVLREPANLFLVFIFPLVLTLAFGASFGALGGGESRYSIALVNLDEGQWGSTFKTALTGITAVEVRDYVETAGALSDLQQGQLKAVIVIPLNFTPSIQSYKANPSEPGMWIYATISLSVDEGSMVAAAAIPPLVQQVISGVVLGSSMSAQLPIALGAPTMVQAEKLSQFDYMAPGLFSYATIFLIMIVSQALVTEKEQGILRRVGVTPTTVGDIFASQIASNLLISAVQVGVVYAATYVMGFRPLGGILGLSVTLILVFALSVCSVGLGLLVASFAKNSGAATGISFIFILPLMFLGTFVPAPESISRLVPSWYVTDALTSIFLRGAPPTSPTILLHLATMIGYSVAILVAGMLAFRRYGRS